MYIIAMGNRWEVGDSCQSVSNHYIAQVYSMYTGILSSAVRT